MYQRKCVSPGKGILEILILRTQKLEQVGPLLLWLSRHGAELCPFNHHHYINTHAQHGASSCHQMEQCILGGLALHRGS